MSYLVSLCSCSAILGMMACTLQIAVRITPTRVCAELEQRLHPGKASFGVLPFGTVRLPLPFVLLSDQFVYLWV